MDLGLVTSSYTFCLCVIVNSCYTLSERALNMKNMQNYICEGFNTSLNDI